MTFVYCYFFDSVYISNYNGHCIMETWLNDRIFSLPLTQCFVLTFLTFHNFCFVVQDLHLAGHACSVRIRFTQLLIFRAL
jgi:hypothetical protein